MPLNLKQINMGKRDALTNPRDIFAALPDKPWHRLRQEQGEVLKEWHLRRTEQDLVIKLNTGGGKTLVGLLIGQSSLNEGLSPVAYLVPDTYLIDQVIDTAESVGIAVTRDVRDEGFRAGRTILVATFERLVNGRSVFGVRGYKPVVELGTVIVDDAHAALAAARGQFCATLPADCEGYDELLKLFAADLRRQSAKAFSDLEDGDRGQPLRVPPKAVTERADELLQILKKYGSNDAIPSFFFSWPLVAEQLNLAFITFSDRVVEIKTPCPQIDMIPAFDRATRRVYLTATLSDESILVTELGADPTGVITPITPDRASDLGDRMILAPMSINPRLSSDAIRTMVREFADGDRNGDDTLEATPVNVVVLVPSRRVADEWEPFADEIVNVETMRPVVQRLTDGEHLGVVVLINKYDGVDLPDDACRLLVIDGVPTPLTPSEQRESAALSGSARFVARTVQRIEQGMGRGIRDVEDYCAVLLMTREAALTIQDPRQRRFYSPATHAQIDLSLVVAGQIEGEGLEEVRNALDVFLERDEEWLTASRTATAEVEYARGGGVSPIAIARRRAFDKAVAGDIEAAVSEIRSALNTVTDDLETGWYMEELAAYQQLVSPVDAQKTLSKAREKNVAVLKPDAQLRKHAVKGPQRQAEAAAAYLGANYADPITFRLAVGNLFDNITWELREAVDKAEEQIRILGLHLGFESTRPEKEYGDGGPDNLWGLTPTRNAIIELKTGITRDDTRIVKSEAEQLLHSLEWDRNSNPHVQNQIPVMVHPDTTLHPAAVLNAATRIITPDDLVKLRKDVETFADELSSAKSWADPIAVAEALQRNRLTADQVLPAHSSKPTKKRK